MFNSETLEVGIGMAFLFLLMSLICTGIKEWIEGIFKWRAMDLERALRVMLDDNNGKLSTHLFSHPVISSLYQGQYDASKLKTSVMPRWLTALMAKKGTTGIPPDSGSSAHMAWRARRTLPSYIPAAQFATALIDLVGRGPANVDGDSAPHAPLTIAQLRERAAALASPFLRRAVLTAIDHCEGDLKQLTENLQRWFDGSMDRASGWYKRRTQTVLFVLGVLAAGVLNVDALYVMGRLTADKTFRETVVNAAARVEAPAAAAVPAASAAEVAAAAASAASSAGPPRPSLDAARAARDMLEQVGMPIGWLTEVRNADRTTSLLKPLQMCQGDLADGCKASGYSGWRVLAGWLMTAFAVMLGAPFWFDVLNKFMVIRSTVKPREKSREEGSEDRADPLAAKDAPAGLPLAPIKPAGSRQSDDKPGAAAAAPPPPPQAFVANEWRAGVVNPHEVPL